MLAPALAEVPDVDDATISGWSMGSSRARPKR